MHRRELAVVAQGLADLRDELLDPDKGGPIDAPTYQGVMLTISKLCDTFAQVNPSFDKARFMAAAAPENATRRHRD